MNDNNTIKQYQEISDDASAMSGILTDDSVMQFGVAASAVGDFNEDGFVDVVV